MEKLIKSGLLFLLLLSVSTLWAQPKLDDCRAMVERGNYREAKAGLLQLVEQKTKHKEEAYYWLGVIHFEENELDFAKEAFAKGLAIKDKSPLNLAGMGRVLVREGAVAEAKPMLEKALKYNHGKDPEADMAVAAAYLELGEKERADARIILYKLETEAPDNPRPSLVLGDFYAYHHTPDPALERYEKVIKKAPNYVPAYVAAANIKVDQQAYEEAGQYLNQAIQIDPEYAPAYRHRGELWLKAGNYEQARNDYSRYVELSGNDTRARIRYGSFLYLTGNYDEALEQFAMVRKEGKATNLVERLSGYCFFETGQLEQARAHLDTYFAQSKKGDLLAEDHFYYGQVLIAQGEREVGENHVNQAIALKPEFNSFFGELAAKARHRKDYSEQAHYMQLYLANKSDKTQQEIFRLGKACYFAEDFDCALENFQQVVEMAPEKVEVYYWIGESAKKLTDEERGKAIQIEASQQVMDLLGEKETLTEDESRYLLSACTHLAIVTYDQQEDGTGNCQDAMSYLLKILELTPDNEGIQALVDYCEQNQ